MTDPAKPLVVREWANIAGFVERGYGLNQKDAAVLVAELRSRPTQCALEAIQKQLAATTNYVVDDEAAPEFVKFANGRTVYLNQDGPCPYLVIGMAALAGKDPTE